VFFLWHTAMLSQGYMDILVTTMNGNAFALQTMVPYDPILTWTEQNLCSRNGGTWRNQYHGIYVLPSSRTFRDVIGATSYFYFASVCRGHSCPQKLKRARPHINVCMRCVLLLRCHDEGAI
jgi:hypothetical protein